MPSTVVTVSQLGRFVGSLLEEQKQLADLLVRGEVSNLSYRSSSGHLYFSLCDGDCSMRCVMFSRYASSLKQFPEDGAVVIVRCNVRLYDRDGSISLIAYDIQELGAGKQQQSIDALKKKLWDEGLFAAASKRELPPFPRAVGVVTSPDGAALQDIIATFATHNPLVRLVVFPATVQGAGAADSMCAALAAMQVAGQCQSCVIARGGGSSEDLSAFNDERLVRAVAALTIPVVSAVGHEVDYTLTDLAADARAATPTAACRLLAIPMRQLIQRVEGSQNAMRQTVDSRIALHQRQLERLTLLLSARSPRVELKKNRQTLIFLVKSLEEKERLIIERLLRQTTGALDRLELVNPAQLLRRGYSITSNSGHVVTTVACAAVGDSIVTRLRDGRLVATVTSVEEDSKEWMSE